MFIGFGALITKSVIKINRRLYEHNERNKIIKQQTAFAQNNYIRIDIAYILFHCAMVLLRFVIIYYYFLLFFFLIKSGISFQFHFIRLWNSQRWKWCHTISLYQYIFKITIRKQFKNLKFFSIINEQMSIDMDINVVYILVLIRMVR